MSQKSFDPIAVITDASCFIILNKIESLSLLNQLFTTVITTPEIEAEYGNLPEWVTILPVKNKNTTERTRAYCR